MGGVLSVDHVQTKREIEALLAGAGARPRKRLGQHFLIDGNLMRRLADSADLTPRDVVLEVGGGTGGLTDLLAPCAGTVVCVELDRTLQRVLAARFEACANVTVVPCDILQSKHRLADSVLRLLEQHRPGDGGCAKLVSNLPYQVATPVVMNLLVDHPKVQRLCFTVQAEVGDRLTARPGTKAYGPLAIVTRTLCHIDVLARIPPQAFWPRPEVDSVMVRMNVGASPFGDVEEARRFATLVRRTFDHRRKTLHGALGYVLDDAARQGIDERFDTSRRPERIDHLEWYEIHRTLEQGGP